jgi:hypothetical protein
MSNLELKERKGVWYAVGTIGGERVRKSLGTRDRKEAEGTATGHKWKLRRPVATASE